MGRVVNIQGLNRKIDRKGEKTDGSARESRIVK